MGHSCGQKGLRLPKLCATSLALHTAFIWAGASTVGKAGFGAAGLTIQSTRVIWLWTKACNL